MSDVQIAIIDQQDTQAVLAVPGIQGPMGNVVTGLIPSGSASQPGLAFSGDTDTGLYQPGPNRFAFTTSGVLSCEVDAQGDFRYYGDAVFDDGGTYATTVQVVTPTANRTISFPDATGTVALVAGSTEQVLYNLNGALAGSSTTFNASGGTRFVLPFGYGAGAGGTVTQSGSKSSGVTLNARCGKVTMDSATLSGDTTVTFALTNDQIADNDVLILNHASGGTAGAYVLNAQCSSGTANINVRNITSSGLGEAVVVAFAVIKASVT
jgi:hypothetical protein